MPYPPHLSFLNRTPEQRKAERKARHAKWRASLSDRDWERIVRLADQVTTLDTPARIEDLDAPGIAVGVCLAGFESRTSGARIGTVRNGEVAVLVWRKG